MPEDSDTTWLPELIRMEDFKGNWNSYEQKLYECFHADFILGTPAFEGKIINIIKEPLHNSRESAFWHLISSGEIEQDRIPDLRRCERIKWPRAIIDVADSNRINIWKTKRGKEIRWVLSLKDFSYIVILIDRSQYYIFLTAYIVERRHRRDKLRNEFINYQKSIGRP